MPIEETTWIFLGATLALVAYALLGVGFILALHERDPGSAWLDRRLAESSMDDRRARRIRLVWWWGVVPAVACLAGAVLAVLNVGIMLDREVEDIYAISAAIIAAVRILAYVWQRPAQLLAEMVPYAVLAAAVFNTQNFDWDTWRQQLAGAGAENATAYVVVLVVLEWGLRSVHNWRRRTVGARAEPPPGTRTDD